MFFFFYLCFSSPPCSGNRYPPPPVSKTESFPGSDGEGNSQSNPFFLGVFFFPQIQRGQFSWPSITAWCCPLFPRRIVSSSVVCCCEISRPPPTPPLGFPFFANFSPRLDLGCGCFSAFTPLSLSFLSLPNHLYLVWASDLSLSSRPSFWEELSFSLRFFRSSSWTV